MTRWLEHVATSKIAYICTNIIIYTRIERYTHTQTDTYVQAVTYKTRQVDRYYMYVYSNMYL